MNERITTKPPRWGAGADPFRRPVSLPNLEPSTLYPAERRRPTIVLRRLPDPIREEIERLKKRVRKLETTIRAQ